MDKKTLKKLGCAVMHYHEVDGFYYITQELMLSVSNDALCGVLDLWSMTYPGDSTDKSWKIKAISNVTTFDTSKAGEFIQSIIDILNKG